MGPLPKRFTGSPPGPEVLDRDPVIIVEAALPDERKNLALPLEVDLAGR